MHRDCRTCLKIDHCDRHIECTFDGKFIFWSGIIEGIVISATKTNMYIHNLSDDKTYIVGDLDQINPGFFKITQDTEAL